MDVILFFPDSCRDAGDRLVTKLLPAIPGRDLVVFQNFQDISRLLRHLENKPRVAVLAAGNRQELDELSSLRPLLRDTQIILMLPDEEVETLSRAHRWRPRFLTYFKGNFTTTGIISILKKILSN